MRSRAVSKLVVGGVVAAVLLSIMAGPLNILLVAGDRVSRNGSGPSAEKRYTISSRPVWIMFQQFID
ncbi:hypothetical protein RAA17_02925 [Komagataeibacter rhaeticus]|nr:hypothetical protein [Komagataeibacter rhaeticus]